MTLNLKSEEGIKVFDKLIQSSDILLHNYIDPEKFGMDYEGLQPINSSLIHTSISGFGSNVKKTAFDFTIQAMCGLMSITGTDQPTKVGYAVTDVITGISLFSAINAALFAGERHPEGLGCKLDSSLLHANLFAMSYVPFSFLNSDFDYKGMGNEHPSIVPYTSYKTKDGVFIVIAAATDELCSKLMVALQIEEKTGNEYGTNEIGVKHGDFFNKLIQNKVSTYLKDELVRILEQFNVPYSEIQGMKECFSSDIVGKMNILDKTDSGLQYVKFPVEISENY